MIKLIQLTLLLCVLSVPVTNCQDLNQSDKIIPVYPGSKLKTGLEPGDSKMCCTFVSSDNLGKVVSFYENSLKIKALDPKGLATQVPSLKPAVDGMLKEMPQGAQIRFFVLKVTEFQGQKGAELFEVVNTGTAGTEFSIMESQMSPEDSHFAAEWDGNADQAAFDSGPPESVDTKALVAALPATGPSGYDKSDLNINAQPGSPPSAGVDFSKGMDVNISITINDYKGFSEGLEQNIKAQYENEKAVLVKGKYKGKETLTKVGNDCGGADKIFLVKNRYLIIISTLHVCDFNILNQVIDKMNLEILPD